jgi:hypothetical protein
VPRVNPDDAGDIRRDMREIKFRAWDEIAKKMLKMPLVHPKFAMVDNKFRRWHD